MVNLLADGRRVFGYRKTLVQRTPGALSHQMPRWRLSFVVPALHGLGLTRKRYGHLTGVAIDVDGGVVISSRNKQSVEEQAECLVREVAPYGFPAVAEGYGSRPAPR